MKKSIRFVFIQVALVLCLILVLSPLTTFADDQENSLYFHINLTSMHSIDMDVQFPLETSFELPAALQSSGGTMNLSSVKTYQYLDSDGAETIKSLSESSWALSTKTHTHSINLDTSNCNTHGNLDGKIVFDFQLADGYQVSDFQVKDGNGTTIDQENRLIVSLPAYNEGYYWNEGNPIIAPKASIDVEFTMRTNFGASDGGTVTAQGNTSGTLNSGGYYPAQTVTFTAHPDQGKTIEGWYKDSKFTTPITNSGTQTTYRADLEEPLNVYVKYQTNGANETSSQNSKDSPKTGDDFNLALPVGLLIFGAVGAGVCILLRKRTEEK